MAELIERYVHQVGGYLSKRERTEVEAELRSQIQDQLEDRYGGEPTEDEIVLVLTEMGHPYMIAASYSSEQYLIGPKLYPFMMMVLRYGWLIIPSVVLFTSIFDMVTSGEAITILKLILEPLFNALQVTLMFSAVVVLIFALMERGKIKIDEEGEEFNPRNLAEVDDPRVVDRFEATFGMAFGVIVLVIFVYFLRVGGLTLNFNLNNPGEVIPVPAIWLILLIINSIIIMILITVVLRRNRWTASLWLTETLLEVFGIVCLYFVFYKPIAERIIIAIPALENVPLAEMVALVTGISTLVTRGSKFAKLWTYQSNQSAPYPTPVER